MLTIDFTLFIQIASFLLLILLLNLILFRPIRNILKKRNEIMTSTRETIQSLTLQTSSFSEDLETSTSETRKIGMKEKESSRTEGLEREQRMLKETHSILEDKIKKTRLEIEEKRLKARDSLQADVKGFSNDLAKKFLGRGA